ncbi:hypothetical protein YTPLAS18_06130 [Nitrospira sp.]|nr:hypothetical protein YTPLAS18_06130 [Nitrospira sp.]
MSRYRTSQAVAILLAGVLLLLSGLLYPATVPHALHHAHHQAATHATALCSWLCAAGQLTDAALPLLPADFALVARLTDPIAPDPLIVSIYRPSSRAPPASTF